MVPVPLEYVSTATVGAAGAVHFPPAVPAYQCGPIWTGAALPCCGALSVEGELTPPLTVRLPERFRFSAEIFCATFKVWKLGEVGSAGRRTSGIVVVLTPAPEIWSR